MYIVQCSVVQLCVVSGKSGAAAIRSLLQKTSHSSEDYYCGNNDDDDRKSLWMVLRGKRSFLFLQSPHMHESKIIWSTGKIFVNLDSAIMNANTEMSTNGKSSQTIPQIIFFLILFQFSNKKSPQLSQFLQIFLWCQLGIE